MTWQATANPLISRLRNDRGQELFRCERCQVVRVGHAPHDNKACPYEADTLRAEVQRLRGELKLTDELLAARQAVLDAIPECPTHGSCIPHAMEWIEKAKAAESSLARVEAARAALEKERNILSLAIPLEEDLYSKIDEMLRYLAMGQGYTPNGVARLFVDVQRRMSDDWVQIGRERQERKKAEDALAALRDRRET